MSDEPLMVGESMTDGELDEIEHAANLIIQACRAGDFDTAYIVASTSENPAYLAMYVAEMSS